MSIPQDANMASDFWTFLGYIDSASIYFSSRLKRLSHSKQPFAKLAIFPIVALGPRHVLPTFPRALPCAAVAILYVTVVTVETCHKIRMIMREFAYVSRDKTLIHMLALSKRVSSHDNGNASFSSQLLSN